MSPTSFGFPWLSVLCQGSFYEVDGADDWVYSMEGDDIPFFLVHFDHHPRYFEAKIYEAGSGAPVHPVFNTAWSYAYLPRNSTTTGFFSFEWDGERKSQW